MPNSNHSRNKKALAKAVQRREKARRLRFERSHRKQPLSTAQFAKEFVSEALDLKLILPSTLSYLVIH